MDTPLHGLPSLRALLARAARRVRSTRPSWRTAGPLSVTATGVPLDPARADAFVAVCGGPEAPAAPLTWPHALLTPLHLWLLLDPDFPLPVTGLVHQRERIVRTRTIAVGTPVDVTASIDRYLEGPSGVSVHLCSELRQEGEVVWRHETTAVHRTGPTPARRPYTGDAPRPADGDATWAIPAGTGRRYGLVSGNLDPIHLSRLTAWPYGHRGALVHGMWTVSRAVSELIEPLGPATLDVRFRAPVPQPNHATLARHGARFAVWTPGSDRPAVEGTLLPVAELAAPGLS